MDLKIKDVAELLNVSETTIRRWLLAGKIPAYRLNHQYRFSRIEIEDWLLKQRLENKNHLDMPKTTHTSGNQQYCLYRALHKGRVIDSIAETTKENVIKSALNPIAKDLNLDESVLSELLIDRERLMSTALNNGIALPHPREPICHSHYDYICVVYPEEPIDYGALDGQPVHTLFFLFACKDKTHLHLVAKIAHLSSNPDALEFIKTKPSKEKLLEFVKEWEKTVPHLS